MELNIDISMSDKLDIGATNMTTFYNMNYRGKPKTDI